MKRKRYAVLLMVGVLVVLMLYTEKKQATEVAIPILMYHRIADTRWHDSVDVSRYNTSEKDFETQMRFLYENGYSVISIDDVPAYLKKEKPTPLNPIIITFDDGYSNQFTKAFPILKKYGFTATFYVYTDAIGTPRGMTWDTLSALHDAGMSIGSHSVTHADLKRLLWHPFTLHREIQISKNVLEKNMHIPIHHFSYPYGSYTQSVRNEVQLSGYQTATTTDDDCRNTSTRDVFLLCRIEVYGNMKIDEFMQSIQAASTGTKDLSIKAQVPWMKNIPPIPLMEVMLN